MLYLKWLLDDYPGIGVSDDVWVTKHFGDKRKKYRQCYTKTYSSEIGGIFIDSFDSLLSVHVVGPLHPFSDILLSYGHSKKATNLLLDQHPRLKMFSRLDSVTDEIVKNKAFEGSFFA